MQEPLLIDPCLNISKGCMVKLIAHLLLDASTCHLPHNNSFLHIVDVCAVRHIKVPSSKEPQLRVLPWVCLRVSALPKLLWGRAL